MALFDTLFSSSTVNLVFVIIGVAIYLAFNAPSNAPPRPAAAASTSRPTTSKRAVSAPAARLGSSHIAAAAHTVFSRMPTTSLDCRALFAESDAAVVNDGISLDQDVLDVLREAANISKVHLILHDTSADGLVEAVVKSALDGVRVLGNDAGQVPRHRFLTCSTRVGKVAIVRQIEAAQHIETSEDVHSDLSKFAVAQWLVGSPASSTGLVQKVLALA